MNNQERSNGVHAILFDKASAPARRGPRQDDRDDQGDAEASAGEIENTHEVTLELRHVDDSGVEYWLARELQAVLEYDEWRNFKRVIEKAMTAAGGAETPVQGHSVEVNKLVTTGLGAEREIEDFERSRYACYLIVQNGDPSKPVIANGQTYFAIQTRRAELADDEQFRQPDALRGRQAGARAYALRG